MAVLKNKDGNELILSCICSCDDGLRVKIDNSDEVSYCYQTYISGNWYKEQGSFKDKLKKICAIIRNKDYYYSEIILNKEQWEEYKEWVNKY
jgi:hypothetical protein